VFHIDPLVVLKADPFEFEVRMACANAAIRQMQREEVSPDGR